MPTKKLASRLSGCCICFIPCIHPEDRKLSQANSPSDIKQANINLGAYPSERFGFLTGIVADVAADSTEATKGVWSFEVRITHQENKLMSGSDQFGLRPSMTTSVDIATDKRRLISYFFAPIVDAVFSALGER